MNVRDELDDHGDRHHPPNDAAQQGLRTPDSSRDRASDEHNSRPEEPVDRFLERGRVPDIEPPGGVDE